MSSGIGLFCLIADSHTPILRKTKGICAMPRGPRGERRPADMVGCAIAVARLSVGENSEAPKAPSGRVRSGHAGAKARAEKLTADQRSAVAKKAASARWD